MRSLLRISRSGRRVATATVAVLVTVTMAMPTAGSAADSGRRPRGGELPSWRLTPTGATARLRGLDAVSAKVVWASGSAGTVLRTVDGGRTWQNVSPPAATDLQFRDIEAFDAKRAVVLSIGEGEASRVYVTSDGGRSWQLTFRNDDPRAFYDCAAFFDRHRGLALSDPVDGRFRLIATDDGGRTWRVLGTATMPAALEGEFAFAASGTCLVTSGRHDAWFATGGGAQARVFHSQDGGRSWRVTATPVRSGPTAGIYSLAFRNRRQGLAIGGDFTVPDTAENGLALTGDGGDTWSVVGAGAPNAYRSGSTWVPHTRRTAIAVGPTGSDITTDGGWHWQRFDTGSFDSVQCARDGACWASGADGRLARLVDRQR